MIYSINPTKDASLYSNSSSMNTGLDEILEVAKVMTTATTRYIVRSLIKFDITSFPASLISGSVSGSRQFVLKLYATEPENLKSNYTVDVLPVTASWTMGQGKRFNTPITTEGTSWDFRTGYTTDSSSIVDWRYNSASIGIYDGYNGGAWTAVASPSCSQAFEYTTADTNIDVTAIVEQWILGAYANEGFLVKFPASAEAEADTTSYGTLKFFSKDTNTVYKPKLFLKYDDSTNAYGSGTLNADDTVVYVKGIKEKYNTTSTEKMRLLARDRFPARTFQTTASQYTSFNYLPTTSYYGVKDLYTGEMVIDYDVDYTKVSADASGNYFYFNFGTLFPNRLYKFMFQVYRNDFITQSFDTGVAFKVVK